MRLKSLIAALLLSGTPTFGAVSSEVEIQARMVEDCTTLLDQLLGPGRAKVVIRLQGEHNEIKTQTEFLTPLTSSKTAAALPGFMVSRLLEKTYDLVQRDQEQSTRTSSFAIKKVEAFVVIDETVPPSRCAPSNASSPISSGSTSSAGTAWT